MKCIHCKESFRGAKGVENTCPHCGELCPAQPGRQERLRQKLERLGVPMHESQWDASALLERIKALEECLGEAVALSQSARIGTAAVERWGKVLRDNHSPTQP